MMGVAADYGPPMDIHGREVGTVAERDGAISRFLSTYGPVITKSTKDAGKKNGGRRGNQQRGRRGVVTQAAVAKLFVIPNCSHRGPCRMVVMRGVFEYGVKDWATGSDTGIRGIMSMEHAHLATALWVAQRLRTQMDAIEEWRLPAFPLEVLKILESNGIQVPADVDSTPGHEGREEHAEYASTTEPTLHRR